MPSVLFKQGDTELQGEDLGHEHPSLPTWISPLVSSCHCRDAPSHFLPPLSRMGREQEKPCSKLSDINPITLLMDRASSPTGHCCSQEYPGCSWREAQGGSPGPLLAQCHGNDSQGCAARWHVPERALPALLSAVAQTVMPICSRRPCSAI